jgi:hypothetical protein
MPVLSLLAVLWMIVDRLERIPTKVMLLEHVLCYFPFAIHPGWITVATALNVSVVLVSAGCEHAIQRCAAIVALLLLGLIAMTWLLPDAPEHAIPVVRTLS